MKQRSHLPYVRNQFTKTIFNRKEHLTATYTAELQRTKQPPDADWRNNDKQ
jgi:hypothetical protein